MCKRLFAIDIKYKTKTHIIKCVFVNLVCGHYELDSEFQYCNSLKTEIPDRARNDRSYNILNPFYPH